MDDDEVVRVLQKLGVPRGGREVGVAVGIRQPVRVALEAVVNGLRDAEERLVAGDHLPVDVEAEVAEEGTPDRRSSTPPRTGLR